MDSLLDIPLVKGINITNHGSPSLHIYCNAGDEKTLLDSLPFWVTSLGRAYIGHRQVIIDMHKCK